MGKYVVLYYSSPEVMEGMKHASPEDMQEGIKSWMAWGQKCGDGIVDFGAPLGGGMRVGKSGNSPSGSGVMMYSILQAESMEGASGPGAGPSALEIGRATARSKFTSA